MKFNETELPGSYLVELEPSWDERGFFARSWSRREFAEKGLDVDLNESAISFNPRAGTLRGLHYQIAPFEETKLVRCTAGAIFDVIVDLRPSSRTRGRWAGFQLSAENRLMLYVPKGFAHGFQTLTDHSEVSYLLSGSYSPDHARVIRWDDADLGIRWPAMPTVISDRDRGSKR